MEPGSHLIIFDGSAAMYRAFYANADMVSSAGHPIGAVHGLAYLIAGLLKDEHSTHAIAAFDAGSKTFRNDIYAAYKGHRPSPPDELSSQFGLSRDTFRAFGIPVVQIENFEADDIIATYTREACEIGCKVTIITSDKDLFPLVDNDGVSLLSWNHLWGKVEGAPRYNRVDDAYVRAKFGVGPSQLWDVLAIAGDASDNIPGVAGVGIKGAAALISQFGDLENAIQKGHVAHDGKKGRKLQTDAANARLSMKLLTLDDRVPLPIKLDENGDSFLALPFGIMAESATDFLRSHGLEEAISFVERMLGESVA